VSPTSIPSQAPSKSECETTQGIFGQVSQNADVRIDFSYELEVSVASISNKIIEDDILPDLEGAIVDSILPATFPDDCSMDRRNLRVASRRLEIVAVSKYPEDEILEDSEYNFSATREWQTQMLTIHLLTNPNQFFHEYSHVHYCLGRQYMCGYQWYYDLLRQ
jgi:hypothetical protein